MDSMESEQKYYSKNQIENFVKKYSETYDYGHSSTYTWFIKKMNGFLDLPGNTVLIYKHKIE